MSKEREEALNLFHSFNIPSVELYSKAERERRRMGRLFLIHLEGKIYTCRTCHNHLAKYSEVLSKSFHSKHGKAYLFNTVVNVCVGPKEERMMTTGLHTVSDVHCTCCNRIVGWKYEVANEKSQKYKEGKFILERAKMIDSDV